MSLVYKPYGIAISGAAAFDIVAPVAGTQVLIRQINLDNIDSRNHIFFLSWYDGTATSYIFARFNPAAGARNQWNGLVSADGDNGEKIAVTSFFAPATVNPQGVAHGAIDSSGVWKTRGITVTGNATFTDLVPIPAAGKQSVVKQMNFYNQDTVAHTFTPRMPFALANVSYPTTASVANGTHLQLSDNTTLEATIAKFQMSKNAATTTTDPRCVATWLEEEV